MTQDADRVFADAVHDPTGYHYEYFDCNRDTRDWRGRDICRAVVQRIECITFCGPFCGAQRNDTGRARPTASAASETFSVCYRGAKSKAKSRQRITQTAY